MRAPLSLFKADHHPRAASFACLLMLASLLSSCESSDRSSPNNRQLGGQTVSQVSIQTTANKVDIAATTGKGRQLKASGATTKEAVDNLEKAAREAR